MEDSICDVGDVEESSAKFYATAHNEVEELESNESSEVSDASAVSLRGPRLRKLQVDGDDISSSSFDDDEEEDGDSELTESDNYNEENLWNTSEEENLDVAECERRSNVRIIIYK